MSDMSGAEMLCFFLGAAVGGMIVGLTLGSFGWFPVVFVSLFVGLLWGIIFKGVILPAIRGK